MTDTARIMADHGIIPAETLDPIAKFCDSRIASDTYQQGLVAARTLIGLRALELDAKDNPESKMKANALANVANEINGVIRGAQPVPDHIVDATKMVAEGDAEAEAADYPPEPEVACVESTDDTISRLRRAAREIDPRFAGHHENIDFAIQRLRDLTQSFLDACRANDALTAERDALRADAERYRWIRSRDTDTISMGGVFAGQTPQNVILTEEHLDAAVDAAICAHEENDA